MEARRWLRSQQIGYASERLPTCMHLLPPICTHTHLQLLLPLLFLLLFALRR